MGIDVSMWAYRSGEDYNKRCYAVIPDDEGGYIRESYFRSEYYATKILFEEAWTRETCHLQPEPDLLKERLEEAIKATMLRYRNLEDGVETGSAKELREVENDQIARVTKFVTRYTQEFNEGNDPFITVSY